MIINNALRNPFILFIYLSYCDDVIEVKLFQESSKDISMDRKMDTEAKINVLKELIDVRDQTSDCNMLSMEEVNELTDFFSSSG